MAFLGKLLAPMIPKLIEFLAINVYKLAQWLWEKWEHKGEVNAEMSKIEKQKERLKKAIDNAYDGSPPTSDQKKEITRAFYELVRDY